MSAESFLLLPQYKQNVEMLIHTNSFQHIVLFLLIFLFNSFHCADYGKNDALLCSAIQGDYHLAISLCGTMWQWM